MNEMEVGQQWDCLEAHGYPVSVLGFSPDGSMLASGDVERTLRIWKNGEVSLALDLSSLSQKVKPMERMRSLVFSNDSSQLYVSAGETLQSLDVNSGHYIWGYTAPRMMSFLITSPLRVAVSKPSGLVFCSFEDGEMGLWDGYGRLQAMWSDTDAPAFAGFLQNERYLVGSDRICICLWDVVDQVKLDKLELNHRIQSFQTHPTEDLFATHSLRTCEIYDALTGGKIAEVSTRLGLPLMAFRPFHQQIAILEDKSILIYNYRTGQQQWLPTNADRITSLCWSAHGAYLAIGCGNGLVYVTKAD